MNKAELLEQLQKKIDKALPSGYRTGLEEAIELVEQLTCITDPEFPAVIKEPVPLRDYGVLYLVEDGSDGYYYITRQDNYIHRCMTWKSAERLWKGTIEAYYPETRETK